MTNISVIVPVYKVEKYLPKCIDSLLSQTIQNIEIILVDDGSPDNSGAICDEYAAKDSRIKVIHIPNGGVSTARNIGIENAKGEWVSFIDSDDWIEDDYLFSMYNHAKKYDLDIVVAGVTVEFSNEDRISIQKNEQQEVFTVTRDLGKAYHNLIKKSLSHYLWNKLYKKSFLDEYNIKMLPGIPVGEDFLFNIDAFINAKAIGLVTNIGYHYIRTGGESALTRYHSNLDIAYKKSLDSIKAFSDHYNMAYEMQAYIDSMQIGLHCLHIGNIFKKDSPLSFSEKVKWYRKFSKEHKAEILDLNSKLPNPGFLVKLMIFSLRFNSPVLAISFYSLIFFMRYQFVGLYLRFKRGRF